MDNYFLHLKFTLIPYSNIDIPSFPFCQKVKFSIATVLLKEWQFEQITIIAYNFYKKEISIVYIYQ